MNYYDELIEKIENLLSEKEYEEVKTLIISELNLPYVPKDIESKLNSYLSIIKNATYTIKTLSDDEILNYLDDSFDKQLLAVDELSRKNLRDYIDCCDSYLKGSGYANAKALLIDSLIRQEINYNFSFLNDGSLIEFNPSEMNVIEETDDFKDALKILGEYYLKDPSKLQMGTELLYKESLLTLPMQINGKNVSKKIIDYIDKAFSAK